MSDMMIYGATGYVGEHLARSLSRLGEVPIIAARDGIKLRRVAQETGLQLRSFGLDQSEAIDAALEGVSVLLNCAGPFRDTADALSDACVRTGTHYLDITGEIPVYEALHAKDAKAKARGVMLLPGVGFDVTATDCLALHLKQRLPTATHLTIAFQSVGPAGLPPGTQRTALYMLQYGDRVRRNGILTKPESSKSKEVDFGNGPVNVQLVPWGDVFTAYHSTGIPNIEDYFAPPPSLRRQIALGRALAPLTSFRPVLNLLLKTVRPGPSIELRSRTKTHVWAEATNECGGRVVSRLHGPEAGLDWTTLTAIGAAQKARRGLAISGYQTPASAFGADFVLEGPGVVREVLV